MLEGRVSAWRDEVRGVMETKEVEPALAGRHCVTLFMNLGIIAIFEGCKGPLGGEIFSAMEASGH